MKPNKGEAVVYISDAGLLSSTCSERIYFEIKHKAPFSRSFTSDSGAGTTVSYLRRPLQDDGNTAVSSAVATINQPP